MAELTADVGRRERNARWLDAVMAIAVIVLIFFVVAQVLLGGRSFDTAYMASVLPAFGPAALLAFSATAVAYVVGMGIGFFVGWARTLRPLSTIERPGGSSHAFSASELLFAAFRRFFRRFATFYVEAVRGTPLLVQILFIWSITLVLAPAEWDIFTISLFAGVLAMTISTGGYQGEIFRGGIQAVPSGQVEAARAVGLSRWKAMRRVVLPQTFRLVIPPLTNEFIALFKASSLLFIIGVMELTFVYKRLAFFNPQIFEIFILVTAIYLSITIPLSFVSRYLERRLRIAGLGVAPRGRGAGTAR